MGTWEQWGKKTRGKWSPEFNGPACLVGSVAGDKPVAIGPFASCHAAVQYAENTDLDDWLIMPLETPDKKPIQGEE